MTKIGFISDLHADRNRHYSQDDFIYHLQKQADEKELDYLINLGDISNRYSDTSSFMTKIQTGQSTKHFFIPGNHDFWDLDEEFESTSAIFEAYRNHPASLLGKSLKLTDKFSLVAHPAWYNYAFAASRFSEAELNTGKHGWGYWQDKKFLDWGMSDKELSKAFATDIDQQLKKVASEEIILATHFLTLADLCPPVNKKPFAFFNAFMGTSDLDPLKEKYPIHRIVMGHVHHRVTYNKKGIDYTTVCLGYFKQWRSDDLADELHRSMLVLDLES